MAQFIFSENYDNQLERIEGYILEAADSIDKVSEFLDQHDQVLRFIEQNPTPTAPTPRSATPLDHSAKAGPQCSGR